MLLPNRRITMADVAREADVSLMTVSRVVNNKDSVRSETQQKVLEVVERLGYRPSNLARGLATQKTGTIGLVVPDNANPYFSEVARGVEHLAYTSGYTVAEERFNTLGRYFMLKASFKLSKVAG